MCRGFSNLALALANNAIKHAVKFFVYNVFIYFPDCTSVSIVLSSADENVTVRSTVLLVCVAYGGSTAPSVVWYRNGRPITNDTDVRVSYHAAISLYYYCHPQNILFNFSYT